MQISYFGLGSFKISNKNYSAIVNPFSKESGLVPPRGNADLVILSEASNPLHSYFQSISGGPFIIDTPGEYDVKDFAVDAVPIRQGDKLITAHLIQTEGISILNLGHISEFKLTENEVEDLGDIDILLVPVGGGSVMEYDAAAKVAALLEPRIVIPMDYKIPNLKIDFEGIDKFIKQMGGKSESMEKLSLKKKDLTEDILKVITLEPLR